MNEVIAGQHDQTINSLVDLCVESWRFTRLFSKLLSKLDAGDASRYQNQFRYYIKKLEDSLEPHGLKLVNLEGQLYDPGVAATALNIGDFEPDDVLLIDQMLEPIILSADGLIKTGTVMLRKASI